MTNCLSCNITCHHPCEIPDDAQKRGCEAIDQHTGKCKVCPKKCDWTFHKNTKYKITYETVYVQRTYADMKNRYEEARHKSLTIDRFIQNMKDEANAKCSMLKDMMDKVNRYRTRLQQNALSTHLSSEEYIDLMIESEKREHKTGYADRIQTLEELKQEMKRRSLLECVHLK